MRLAIFIALLLSASASAESTVGMCFAFPDSGTLNIFEVEAKLPVKTCMIVLFADEHGPAHEAGLQGYDVITHVGGELISSFEVASEAFAKAAPGKPISVLYQRPVVRGQRVNWRRLRTKVTPVEKIEFLKKVVISEENPATASTIYRFHEDKPKLPESTQLEVLLVKTDGITTPVLKPIYVGDIDWLFARRLTFITDSDRIEITPDDWGRDNTHKQTWEWCHVAGPEDSPERKALEALANQKLISVVFHGEDYYSEYNVKLYEGYKASLMMDYLKEVLR